LSRVWPTRRSPRSLVMQTGLRPRRSSRPLRRHPPARPDLRQPAPELSCAVPDRSPVLPPPRRQVEVVRVVWCRPAARAVPRLDRLGRSAEAPLRSRWSFHRPAAPNVPVAAVPTEARTIAPSLRDRWRLTCRSRRHGPWFPPLVVPRGRASLPRSRPRLVLQRQRQALLPELARPRRALGLGPPRRMMGLLALMAPR